MPGEFGPMYQDGLLSIENAEDVAQMDLARCQVGVQVSEDGRVWVCINGVSYLRFKPWVPAQRSFFNADGSPTDYLGYVEETDEE